MPQWCCGLLANSSFYGLFCTSAFVAFLLLQVTRPKCLAAPESIFLFLFFLQQQGKLRILILSGFDACSYCDYCFPFSSVYLKKQLFTGPYI